MAWFPQNCRSCQTRYGIRCTKAITCKAGAVDLEGNKIESVGLLAMYGGSLLCFSPCMRPSNIGPSLAARARLAGSRQNCKPQQYSIARGMSISGPSKLWFQTIQSDAVCFSSRGSLCDRCRPLPSWLWETAPFPFEHKFSAGHASMGLPGSRYLKELHRYIRAIPVLWLN